jgi:CheY-like chemotaxis protein
MFAAFAQGDSVFVREHGGLGLGLAVVKGFMELQGGRVTARSDGLGCGSEFVVSLAAAGPSAAAPVRARREPSTCSRSILVIDDSVDGAKTLADVLELMGHRVEVALDGPSGLDLARRFKPEIVLCDIGLPNVSGYDVARSLREEGSLQATRVIAVTGYTQPEDVRRALEAGFDGHLAKPLDLDALEQLLASPDQ